MLEIRAWLRLNPQLGVNAALLPNRSSNAMTRTNVAEHLHLAVHSAAKTIGSLDKRCISPHMIRHTTAMHLLQSGVDISVITLWLGHESPTTTHMYVEADLVITRVYRTSGLTLMEYRYGEPIGLYVGRNGFCRAAYCPLAMRAGSGEAYQPAVPIRRGRHWPLCRGRASRWA